MATTTDLEKLVINYLTQDQYDDAREAGTLNANELYLTPDTGSTGGTVTSITAGDGLAGGTITTSGTISHADTSSQSSVSNSGRTYIQSVTLDTYGHVTGLSSATESVTDTDTKVTQAYSTTNNSYPVLFSATSGITSTSSRGATTAILNNAIYVNPSTGNLQVTKLNSYTPAAAMAKAVDTSISAASTSANLPTSAAVAAFVEGKGYITSYTDTNTWRTIQVNGTDILGSGITTNKLNLKNGTNVSLSNSNGTVTINGPDLSNYATLDDIGQLGGGTVTSIATTSPISGGTITTTGTISHATSGVGTAVTTAGFYKFKYDTYGHVTGVSSVTASDITSLVTIPTNTDENVKSLATATTAASSYYITGSSSSSDTTGTLNKHAAAYLYMTANNTTGGYAQLRLGNTTATSSSGGKEGQIRLYGTNATYYLDLKPGAIASSNKTITFPNASGTVALTSDIPDVSGKIDTAGTGLSKSGTTLNHSNSVTAKSTQAVYPITFDAQGHITGSGTAVTIPTIPGIATSSTAGLVKPWKSYSGASSGPTATTGTTAPTINSISNTSGKYYAVEMDVNGRMFVNVPWSAGGDLPSTTGSSTTGITVSAHSTGTVRGVKTGTSSTTTASKASGGNGSAPSLTVTSTTVANSITGAIDSSDSTMLVISLGTTSVGSASGWSAGNASTWSFTDVTVPIRADSDSTFVTSTTHTVTDPGHTHSV